MYQVKLSRRIKRHKDIGYEIETMNDCMIYCSEEYRDSKNEYLKAIQQEAEHQSCIDYSSLVSIVQLYSYDIITKESRLMKTISLQNF